MKQMFMFVLNILCHNLLGMNRPLVGHELIESGYETSEPGYRGIVGYERSMGTKRLVSREVGLPPAGAKANELIAKHIHTRGFVLGYFSIYT